MPADQALCSRVHRRIIEWSRQAPGTTAINREISTAINDAIAIVALRRRETRVERVRHLLGGEHRHRLRAQMRRDGVAHGVGVPILGEVDMRHLAERMHARVGAPGPADLHALAAERLDRQHQCALHRGRRALHLPANEGSAVIFDRELVARHGSQPRSSKAGG